MVLDFFIQPLDVLFKVSRGIFMNAGTGLVLL